MLPKLNSAYIAALIVTVLGLTALPRAADAFFCFSFQFGGGPRYSLAAPSGPFGPWYGPAINNPSFGYGGFPGGYGGPWTGWGSPGPWRDMSGAPMTYSPYAVGPSRYAPMGSVPPWQSPWQPSPWSGGYYP